MVTPRFRLRPISSSLRAMLFGAVLLSSVAVALERPALLLPEVYHAQVDASCCLVSEKLDGVRAFWDGHRLISRGGNEIRAPRWFIEALPPEKLDGELWLGRGTFERLSGLVRRESPDDDGWRQVRYMVFELPEAPGSFAERAARIKEIAARANVPWLQAVEHFRVGDSGILSRRMDEVVRAGGEGLVLHRADAAYITGRSDILLKLKPWLDAEATVLEHLPGKGKYAGLLGALRVRTPDGREFSLGTGFTDEYRRNPPPIGAVVTYRYWDVTNKGMPRFASFWRLRAD